MFIQGFGNQYKMFKKFSGCIFKRFIMHGNFQCHIHHIQAHTFPSSLFHRPVPVAYLQAIAILRLNTPILSKPKKSSFENVITIDIFPVDPPGKIDKQFLKYLF